MRPHLGDGRHRFGKDSAANLRHRLLVLFGLFALTGASLHGQNSIKGKGAFTNVIPAAALAAPASAPAKSAEQLGPFSPTESAQSFHVFDDLVWEQVLAEPIVAQPVFLTFDERGRMWVVQYRQYPHPAGIKMVSRDNFWRAVYDKVPPPPPHHFRGVDKITIHEDTDGDGVFDKHKTFVDGLNIATSVALGRGGVFVLNPPYLLFYPDKNHDDVPDGDPQVLLSGFGLEDTHSVANSLRWGPDGWLYGCQGSTVTANILVYGADGKVLDEDASGQSSVVSRQSPPRTTDNGQRTTRRPMRPIYSQGQNIWRYHPEKRLYEVFSEGGGNAFGLEIDSAGRIFSGHNGGNTRGFHYLQGAYLQKGFDKHGPLSNPYAFGYFPQMPHNDADRFTHNFVIYDSGALGERYQGRLFGVEPLQGRIVMAEITPDGSTFRTRDLGFPVTSDDKWFRPVDIKLGPDGALYVCDWYDRQVNHYRNAEGQMDASNGRIYRLRSRKSEVGSRNAPPASNSSPKPSQVVSGHGKFDLLSFKPNALFKLLGHPNRWVRSEALRVMHDLDNVQVAGEVVNAALDRATAKLTEPEARERELAGPLEIIWAANGLRTTPTLLDALKQNKLESRDGMARSWAIRLLGDERQVSWQVAKRLADLAAHDPDVEVRAQLACTAKRLPATNALPIVRELMMRDQDEKDPRLPLLLWWAIEDKCATDRDAVLALFADRELWNAPIVQTTILSRLMRRYAATGKREDLLTCAKLFAMSPGTGQTAKLTQGFEEAYKGRPLVALPDELLSAMEKAGGESILIAARRGKPDAIERSLALVADAKADASLRLQLIETLGEVHAPKAVPVLLSVARDEKSGELRRAALSALQSFDSADIAGEVLTQLPSYPPDVRPAAFTLLASRPAWSLALLQAVDAGRFEKAVVPMDTVRRIKALADSPNNVQRSTLNAQLLAKHWPNVRQATSAELELEITRLTEVINATTGSPYSGKKLFLESCGVCHKLFNVGAQIGPDLTIYKRDDLANMLLNVVNPNAEIREGYETFNLETKDGRNLTGFLADKDAQVVVLRGADGQSVAVPRAEILTMNPAGLSLMPEGLLANLTDQQVRDLFAFLRSTQPLPE